MPSKTVAPAAPKVKKESRPHFYALGRRKTAVAQVRLFPEGTGKVVVNDQPVEAYFFGVLLEKALQPLKVLGVGKNYDLTITVRGGGINGQADSVCHGLSRALGLADEASRTTLKRSGFLTRDARSKERKKFGLKKARRSPQWSKR